MVTICQRFNNVGRRFLARKDDKWSGGDNKELGTVVI